MTQVKVGVVTALNEIMCDSDLLSPASPGWNHEAAHPACGKELSATAANASSPGWAASMQLLYLLLTPSLILIRFSM